MTVLRVAVQSGVGMWGAALGSRGKGCPGQNVGRDPKDGKGSSGTAGGTQPGSHGLDPGRAALAPGGQRGGEARQSGEGRREMRPGRGVQGYPHRARPPRTCVKGRQHRVQKLDSAKEAEAFLLVLPRGHSGSTSLTNVAFPAHRLQHVPALLSWSPAWRDQITLLLPPSLLPYLSPSHPLFLNYSGGEKLHRQNAAFG